MDDLRSKLFYEQKNGYDLIDTEEHLKVEDYCKGYIRYLDNTRIELTADWSSYSFEYEMKEASDGNARVEFNIGRQGTGTVHIRNVRYEEVK